MLLKLLRPTGLKRIAIAFTSIFGTIWLLLEPLGLFFPEALDWGLRGYIVLALIALVLAIALNRPRNSVSRSLSSPDTVIEIKIGNLFDEQGHLVIGVNDVFDTELGDVIRPSSVQGQFLQKIYDGDHARLDRDLDAVLASLSDKTYEPNKRQGKKWRYPVGTTLVLGASNLRYFLVAYGRMGNDLMVKSTADDILHSLSILWEQVRLKGHHLPLAIPVIGTDLARVNLSRTAMIQLIAMSFIAASKDKIVTTKLTIVVHSKDVDSIDLYKLEEFLKLACF